MSNRNWIPVRGAQGDHSRQAHADMPEGTYEREVSKEGFFGPAAFFHHRHPPTGWTDFQGPLRPHAFDLAAMNAATSSPWEAPKVLGNSHVDLRFWKLAAPMPALARNADGDQLLFVHQGEGDLFCDYGRLAFEAGDYLYLPRGSMWRLSPAAAAAILMIEATNGHYTFPDRGLLGPTAVFDPAMLDTPVMDEAFREHQARAGPVRVDIKKRDAVSVATFPHNPLDAVGWHGDLSVARLNVRDIRPVASHRYHLPPSVHTTFLADRFVVCTFTPRPFETDPGALKVPFFHNNDDYDEVLFYHAGDFFSRDNIAAGMLTFHPSGFTHGPHPKALKNMLVQAKPATDEYAVMIDSRDPLDVGDGAASVENLAYVDSWKTRPGVKCGAAWLIVAMMLSSCGNSKAYDRKPTDTQIVVQWDITDPVARKMDVISAEQSLNRYFAAEDTISGAAGDLYFEDGNDMGGGVFNIFVYSDRIDETVARIIALDKTGKLPPGMKIGVAVYTDPTHKDWTFRSAYPADLKAFALSQVER